MTFKPVAVVGDVHPQVSSMFYSGATGGTWTSGGIQYQQYDNLVVENKSVVWQATCTFMFSGTNGTSNVNGVEVVTLSAGSTRIMGAQHGVLLDGDSASGTLYGNKLSVSAGGRMREG